MIAEAVYLLCALTSVGCAVLLLRRWSATRSRLLLWTSLGFWGLALQHVLLFVDLVVLPTQVDLLVPRLVTAALALALFVVGLVWEST